MALDFPTSPSTGETYGDWIWDGGKWLSLPLPRPIDGVTSITAGTGLTGGTITVDGTIALAWPEPIANGGTAAGTPQVARANLNANVLYANYMFPGVQNSSNPVQFVNQIFQFGLTSAINLDTNVYWVCNTPSSPGEEVTVYSVHWSASGVIAQVTIENGVYTDQVPLNAVLSIGSISIQRVSGPPSTTLADVFFTICPIYRTS